MKPKEIKALQNILAYLGDSEKDLITEAAAIGLHKDIGILKAYLKGALEGDGKVRQKDFDMIWEQYPNRTGKKAAERHFFASVKKGTDLQLIWEALANYLISDKVMKGFIQNGSTWFNDWQSWVNPTPAMMGTAVHKETEKISRGEEQKKKFILGEK